MSEVEVVEWLKGFANGNTLVLLYAAYSITRFVLIPLYKGGNAIKELAEAATNALNSSVSGHEAIAAELRALNEILSIEKDRE